MAPFSKLALLALVTVSADALLTNPMKTKTTSGIPG